MGALAEHIALEESFVVLKLVEQVVPVVEKVASGDEERNGVEEGEGEAEVDMESVVVQ